LNALDIGVLGISNRSIQILKLKRRKRGMKKQYIWLAHKRHSKRRDWCTPYGERHRNIVVYGECL